MSAFSYLSEELRARISNYFPGGATLKPIQEKAIPEILAGKNCILSAQTAGGKTEAAFWPLLDLIRQEIQNRTNLSVSCIYLSPLTALLNNIEPRIKQYTEFISGEVFKWHGGISYASRKKTISNPPDILLTTPESLEVILDSPSYPHKLFFEGLKFIVIDEVHYFVDSDRGAQLVSLLERLSNICGNDLQRIGLSATVGNPEEVLKYFCGSSKRTQSSLVVKEENRQVEKEGKKILLEYYPNTGNYQENIGNRVFQHITKGSLKKSIIFTKSRQNAELFGKYLDEKFKNEKVEDRIHVHHGSVSQTLREEAEQLINLKNQEGNRCIVSTSTLELGIDIGGLKTVIQVDEFSSVSSYLQRLGRTGREKGESQNLLSLSTCQFDFLKNLAILALGEEGHVESYWPSKQNYSLFFQQLLGSVRSQYGIIFDDFWEIVKYAYPFNKITKEEATFIVEHGLNQKYFTKADNLLLIGEEGEKEFSKQNWINSYSTFETPPAVKVIKNKQEIGTLDAWWVFNNALPYVFILGGKKLRAIELDEEHGILYVKEASTAEPPAWSSSGALTHKLVAQQMRHLLISDDVPKYIDNHSASINCLKNMRTSVNRGLLNIEGLGFEFLDSNFTNIFLYTFSGDRLNHTLALIFESYIELEIKDLNALSFRIISKKLSKIELIKKIEDLLESFSKGSLFDLDNPEITFNNLKIESESPTKFSKYLPKDLQLKQYLNEIYDFHGLQNWLSKIRNRPSSNLLIKTTSSGLPKLIKDSFGL